MSLIDKTYFIGEINLPGLQNSDNVDALTVFIQKYEQRYLQQALGYPLWKLFNASYNPGPAKGRFLILQEGAEFTNDKGWVNLWTGLTNTELLSPIANYIYYWYTRDNVTFTSTIGEVKSNSENSQNADAMIKQMRAYNEMVDQTELLRDFLKYAVDGDGNILFPEWEVDNPSSKRQAFKFEKITFF